ncbi:hypothetical protein TrRE_jg1167, partial [Triparma retinervis]
SYDPTLLEPDIQVVIPTAASRRSGNFDFDVEEEMRKGEEEVKKNIERELDAMKTSSTSATPAPPLKTNQKTRKRRERRKKNKTLLTFSKPPQQPIGGMVNKSSIKKRRENKKIGGPGDDDVGGEVIATMKQNMAFQFGFDAKF